MDGRIMSGNAAIYFEPEGYSISGPRLMGRNAAGFSFLNGFIEHGKLDRFAAYTEKPEHFQSFKAIIEAQHPGKDVISIDPETYADLASVGCLYLPGPGLSESAWKRSKIAERGWSLCGITHTTLSGRAMDAITGILTAPVQPWDALICTSRAVRDTVRALLEAEAEHLKSRLGATRFPLPKLPLIPLGIDSNSFFYSDAERKAARQALNIEEKAVVILFTGRLSFHAKAHPAPLYQALEKASQNQKITLIECGWFANDFIKSAFDEAADHLAPSIRRVLLDGRMAENRQKAWASADIFASLTDNLQETFGITPVEAMAAGMPCVVSDWDGYRDTVRHGVDGFRVATFQPFSGFAEDLATRHALESDNYDHYCGLTSQLIAVDLGETIDALKTLIENPDLRRKMGESGRKRAREFFDWSKIIPIYQALWAELAEERRSYPSLPRKEAIKHPWPARMEPFSAFHSYSTAEIDETTPLRRRHDIGPEQARDTLNLTSFSMGKRLLPMGQDLIDFLYKIPVDEVITPKELILKTGLSINGVISLVMVCLKIGILSVDRGSKPRETI
jgi:glycosyltransferase involved in cell wall biosynthesis